MQHIETIELGSSQSSITFSSIPQDYDDLVFQVSVRTDRGVNAGGLGLTANGSTANFSYIILYGTGSSPGTISSSTNEVAFAAGSNNTANTFGNATIYISNYTKSQSKSISTDDVTENNGSLAYQIIRAALWSDTAALTSAAFSETGGGDLIAGSTISLFGISAGGDGTVTTS